MTNEQFQAFVKDIPNNGDVEIFMLSFTPSYEYLAFPLSEIVVKRGGNIILKCGPAFDRLNALGNISHRNANMPLYDALDSLCELKPDSELVLQRENCKDMWLDVTAGKPNPKYVVTHIFFDEQNDRLFLCGPEIFPEVLMKGMIE